MVKTCETPLPCDGTTCLYAAAVRQHATDLKEKDSKIKTTRADFTQFLEGVEQNILPHCQQKKTLEKTILEATNVAVDHFNL